MIKAFNFRSSHRFKALDVLGVFLCIICVFIFAVHLFQNRHEYINEVDIQGYFLLAKHFSLGDFSSWPLDVYNYRDHVYVLTESGGVIAKYTPGYSLILSLAYRVGGYESALWIGVLMGLVAILSFVGICLSLFDGVTAFILTLILFFSPQMLAELVYPYAHGADIACILLALMCLILFAQSGNIFIGVLAGFFTAYMPLVRPTSILIWPAFLFIFVLLAQKSKKVPLRSLILPLAFFSIPLIFWGLYNQHHFGEFWLTGYSKTHEQNGFDVSSLTKRVPLVLPMLEIMLDWRIAAFCLFGLVVGLFKNRKIVFFALIWILPSFLLYASYYWFSENLGNSYTRFFINLLPAFILLLGAPIKALTWGPYRAFILFLVLGIALHHPPSEFLKVSDRAYSAKSAPLVVRFLSEAKEGDVVYSDRGLFWNFSTIPGVESFQLSSFRNTRNNRHYSQAPSKKCRRRGPWVDTALHLKAHESLKGRLKKNIRKHFTQRIKTHLENGRRVLMACTPQEPCLSWLILSRKFKRRELKVSRHGMHLYEIVLRTPSKKV